ncbi:hypothetical protein TTHERM_00007530 (macronuclear) [Tetrahymena thermophila SB210]|uniref:Uncharacterized protein n=1 Tax=Tetrahymena thermophila (strain SB210) TaxID=312017 RepID=Q22S82_TETTS|nr:hypothetical protein TTHERM_00007530 [Tetrahymena thermophila SB210]EAR87890.2 hypothetical protein TTHERM_00007530 [Tetrahymena thermophila SB210]|eukprot:XP_001008135.2 hypothetical protein TTHERM_00007530 [Tetrahymena thermophila SB210]
MIKNSQNLPENTNSNTHTYNPGSISQIQSYNLHHQDCNSNMNRNLLAQQYNQVQSSQNANNFIQQKYQSCQIMFNTNQNANFQNIYHNQMQCQQNNQENNNAYVYPGQQQANFPSQSYQFNQDIQNQPNQTNQNQQSQLQSQQQQWQQQVQLLPQHQLYNQHNNSQIQNNQCGGIYGLSQNSQYPQNCLQNSSQNNQYLYQQPIQYDNYSQGFQSQQPFNQTNSEQNSSYNQLNQQNNYQQDNLSQQDAHQQFQNGTQNNQENNNAYQLYQQNIQQNNCNSINISQQQSINQLQSQMKINLQSQQDIQNLCFNNQQLLQYQCQQSNNNTNNTNNKTVNKEMSFNFENQDYKQIQPQIQNFQTYQEYQSSNTNQQQQENQQYVNYQEIQNQNDLLQHEQMLQYQKINIQDNSNLKVFQSQQQMYISSQYQLICVGNQQSEESAKSNFGQKLNEQQFLNYQSQQDKSQIQTSQYPQNWDNQQAFQTESNQITQNYNQNTQISDIEQNLQQNIQIPQIYQINEEQNNQKYNIQQQDQYQDFQNICQFQTQTNKFQVISQQIQELNQQQNNEQISNTNLNFNQFQEFYEIQYGMLGKQKQIKIETKEFQQNEISFQFLSALRDFTSQNFEYSKYSQRNNNKIVQPKTLQKYAIEQYPHNDLKQKQFQNLEQENEDSFNYILDLRRGDNSFFRTAMTGFLISLFNKQYDDEEEEDYEQNQLIQQIFIKFYYTECSDITLLEKPYKGVSDLKLSMNYRNYFLNCILYLLAHKFSDYSNSYVISELLKMCYKDDAFDFSMICFGISLCNNEMLSLKNDADFCQFFDSSLGKIDHYQFEMIEIYQSALVQNLQIDIRSFKLIADQKEKQKFLITEELFIPGQKQIILNVKMIQHDNIFKLIYDKKEFQKFKYITNKHKKTYQTNQKIKKQIQVDEDDNVCFQCGQKLEFEPNMHSVLDEATNQEFQFCIEHIYQILSTKQEQIKNDIIIHYKFKLFGQVEQNILVVQYKIQSLFDSIKINKFPQLKIQCHFCKQQDKNKLIDLITSSNILQTVVCLECGSKKIVESQSFKKKHLKFKNIFNKDDNIKTVDLFKNYIRKQSEISKNCQCCQNNLSLHYKLFYFDDIYINLNICQECLQKPKIKLTNLNIEIDNSYYQQFKKNNIEEQKQDSISKLYPNEVLDQVYKVKIQAKEYELEQFKEKNKNTLENKNYDSSRNYINSQKYQNKLEQQQNQTSKIDNQKSDQKIFEQSNTSQTQINKIQGQNIIIKNEKPSINLDQQYKCENYIPNKNIQMSYQNNLQKDQNNLQSLQIQQQQQLINKDFPYSLQNKQKVQQVIQDQQFKTNQIANDNIVQQTEQSTYLSKMCLTKPLINQAYYYQQQNLKREENQITQQEISKQLNSTSEIQIVKKNIQQKNEINQSKIQGQQSHDHNQNIFCIKCKSKNNSQCQSLLIYLYDISKQYKGYYCLQCICNSFQSVQQRFAMYTKAHQLNLFYCYKCGNQFLDKTIKDQIIKCLEKQSVLEKKLCQKCYFNNFIQVYL